MNRNALRSTLVAVLAVGIVAVALVPAQAHKKKYATAATAAASQNKKFFEGDILARPRCKHDRLVSVFNAAAVFQGSDTSNDQGKWMVNAPGTGQTTIPPGAYYALVKKRVLRRGGGHKHVCKAARVDFQVLP